MTPSVYPDFWAYSLAEWLRTNVIVAVFAVLIPSRFVPRAPGEDALDRFWRVFTYGVLYWTATAYVLASIGGFETITLFLALTLTAAFAWSRRRRAALPPEDSRAPGALVLDLLDPHARAARLAFARGAVARWRQDARAWVRTLAQPLTLAACAVLVAAYVLRLWGPLQQAAPGISDFYVHLYWTKALAVHELFMQGLYPLGMHAFAAALAGLSFINPLNLLRFMGPLFGWLMVLSVYTAGREWGGHRLPALVAAALFGLGTTGPLPEGAVQQTQPLPQEFAAAFLLVGCLAAGRYLERGRGQDLSLYGAVLVLDTLVHPYASAGLLLVTSAMVAGVFLFQRGRVRSALVLMAASAAGIIAGLLPLAVGRLLGRPWYGSSLGFVLRPPASQAPVGWAGAFGWLGHHPIVLVSVLFGLLWMGAAALGRGTSRERGLLFGLGAAACAATFFLVQANVSARPWIAADRVGELWSLLLAPLGAAGLFRWLVPAGRYPRAAGLAAAAVIAATLAHWPPVAPRPLLLEPEAAAETYLRIAREFEPFSWTIISPVEQFSEVLGRGWHVELVDFVRRHDPKEAADPHFLLKGERAAGAGGAATGPAGGTIDTPNVFLFVELRPFGLNRALAPEDDVRPLPETSGPEVYEGNARAAIEARAYRWALAYMASHPDSCTIYFKNQEFMVLWIRQ